MVNAMPCMLEETPENKARPRMRLDDGEGGLVLPIYEGRLTLKSYGEPRAPPAARRPGTGPRPPAPSCPNGHSCRLEQTRTPRAIFVHNKWSGAHKLGQQRVLEGLPQQLPQQYGLLMSNLPYRASAPHAAKFPGPEHSFSRLWAPCWTTVASRCPQTGTHGQPEQHGGACASTGQAASAGPPQLICFQHRMRRGVVVARQAAATRAALDQTTICNGANARVQLPPQRLHLQEGPACPFPPPPPNPAPYPAPVPPPPLPPSAPS
jgi:hypothetical protein